jgi:hypothetical protein
MRGGYNLRILEEQLNGEEEHETYHIGIPCIRTAIIFFLFRQEFREVSGFETGAALDGFRLS